MKLLAILLFSFFIMGCADRYRYPCQNPKNWNEAICQKPYCSSTGTCPDDLIGNGKNKNGQTNIVPRGECK